MGADMLVSMLPAFKPTAADRLNMLRYAESYAEDDCFEPDEIVEAVETYCKDCGDNMQSRELAFILPFGLDYEIVITGGLSWGDGPTDAASWMDRLCASSKIYDYMVERAKEDFYRRQMKNRQMIKCPKCGNTDPEHMEHLEEITVRRSIAEIDDDGTLNIGSCYSTFDDDGENGRLWCQKEWQFGQAIRVIDDETGHNVHFLWWDGHRWAPDKMHAHRYELGVVFAIDVAPPDGYTIRTITERCDCEFPLPDHTPLDWV